MRFFFLFFQSRALFDFFLSNLGWQHNRNRLKRGNTFLSKYISSTNKKLKKKICYFSSRLYKWDHITLCRIRIYSNFFFFSKFALVTLMHFNTKGQELGRISSMVLPTWISTNKKTLDLNGTLILIYLPPAWWWNVENTRWKIPAFEFTV